MKTFIDWRLGLEVDLEDQIWWWYCYQSGLVFFL